MSDETTAVETTVSESPAPAASTESIPTTTQAIASQVIQESEAGPPESSDIGETATPSTTVEPMPAVEEKLSPAAEFLKAQGHQAKKVDGRPVWLPYQTVEKMLDRYVERHKTEWDGAKSTLEQDRAALREQVDAVRHAIQQDPQAFLTELAGMDPRYRAFLQPQAQTPQPAAPVSAQMPGPDVTLPDGAKTYSVEGLQGLIQWAVQHQLMPTVEERLKPLAEREQQIQQFQAEQTTRRQIEGTMREASAWPLFGPLAADGSLTPFQTEVLTELQRDSEQARAARTRPTMTLRQAYLEVFSRQQAPDKIRERILSELKTAPKAPALGPSEVPKTTGPRSAAAIAREVIRQAEAS